MRFCFFFATIGCVEPSVFVNERGYPDLASAEASLLPGDVITFAPEVELLANIDLPDNIQMIGPALLYGSDSPLLRTAGELHLTDITLRGGQGDEGSSLQTGALTLDRVTMHDSDGAIAILTNGPVAITDSRFEHDGILLQTRAPTGRPTHVSLTDSIFDGRLSIAADQVELTDLSGSIDLLVNGQQVDLTDLSLNTLTSAGPSTQLIGLELDGAATLTGHSATLLEITGGTWQVDLDTFIASELTVDAIGGVVRTADIFDIEAPWIQFEDAEELTVRRARTDWMRLFADRVNTKDVAAHQLDVWGTGQHAGVTLHGVAPRLRAGLCSLHSVVIQSTEAAVSLQLNAVAIDGLVVVEPQAAIGDFLVDTSSYLILKNVSWIGGRRGATAPPFTQLFIENSLFEAYQFGELTEDTLFTSSVLWSYTEDITPLFGLEVALPGFKSPVDPRLLPTSAYLDRGAFAGPYASQTLARWNAPR